MPSKTARLQGFSILRLWQKENKIPVRETETAPAVFQVRAGGESRGVGRAERDRRRYRGEAQDSRSPLVRIHLWKENTHPNCEWKMLRGKISVQKSFSSE